MDFGEILELIVLAAIAIELFALYSHTKLDNRIDEHLIDVESRIAKSDALMTVLHNHISRFEEQMIRFDEHINRLNENTEKTQDHMTKTNELMEKLDNRINGYLSNTKAND